MTLFCRLASCTHTVCNLEFQGFLESHEHRDHPSGGCTHNWMNEHILMDHFRSWNLEWLALNPGLVIKLGTGLWSVLGSNCAWGRDELMLEPGFWLSSLLLSLQQEYSIKVSTFDLQMKESKLFRNSNSPWLYVAVFVFQIYTTSDFLYSSATVHAIMTLNEY